MECIDWALNGLNRLVWGVPALVLILGVGAYFSFRTRFAQLRFLPRAMVRFFGALGDDAPSDGQVSPFRALCTALAATVGTGNLVGVAGAIALGGPGSIFWMWVAAIAGMMTKFAEVLLALRFRTVHGGEILSGPMYIITRGLGQRWKPLASAYCLFGVFAAFGVGNATQINAVMTGVNQAAAYFGHSLSRTGNLVLTLGLAVLIGALLSGGAGRIGSAAELLVPFVSCTYLILCTGALILRASRIPDAFYAIFSGAFSPRAATGGAVGSVFLALRVGVSRGVFTNEAGMGTASIAHGAAKAVHPGQQALMGIMEVFLDTIVICTMTALVILTSGAEIPYGVDAGALLTMDAFTRVYGPWVSVFLAGALSCFAFATVLGWSLYGARCAQFLLGPGCWKGFVLVQSAAVVLAGVLRTGTVWAVAEIMNGLMAVPNLIALVALRKEVCRLTAEYEMKCGSYAAGGTYENIHQRKPLSAVPHAEIPSFRAGGKETG